MDDMSSSLGQSMPVPDFRYETADAPYAFGVIMPDVSGGYDTTTTEEENFYWSSDKTKVKMECISKETETGTTTSSFTITYDDATKTSSFIFDSNYSGSTNKFTLSIREDPEKASTHGAYVFYETVSATTYNGTTENSSESATGYADDNGGYLKLTSTTGSGLSASVSTCEASFDAAGTTTSQVTTGNAGYSVDTQMITLAGAVEGECYILFDSEIIISGAAIGTGGTTFTSDTLPDNYETFHFIGSGYASADNRITIYLSSETTFSGTAYVYAFSPNETNGDITVRLLGTTSL
jgi:hypothetical protein